MKNRYLLYPTQIGKQFFSSHYFYKQILEIGVRMLKIDNMLQFLRSLIVIMISRCSKILILHVLFYINRF